MNTKDKIKLKAISSFNKSGFEAVNLFELANALGISRGNIIYHFKDKEALLIAIVNDMWEKINLVKQKTRQFPSFQNLREDIRMYMKFQKEYAFIFHNNQVMKHPHVKKIFKSMAERSIEDFNAAISFSIQIGNIRPEVQPGTYNNIAVTGWMLSFFWMAQQAIRGIDNEAYCEKAIWLAIFPHFTEKGIGAFKKYFGTKYYNSLGKTTHKNSKQAITF